MVTGGGITCHEFIAVQPRDSAVGLTFVDAEALKAIYFFHSTSKRAVPDGDNLVGEHGAAYENYRRSVPMLVPFRRRRTSAPPRSTEPVT